jgi:uncharacterized protein (TIGR03382 family)
MNPKLSLSLSLSLSVLALAIPTAQAATVSLSGLSWTATGAAGLIEGTSTVPVSSTGNSPFGYLTTTGGVQDVSPLVLKTDGKGSETSENGSLIRSGVFSAARGDSLSLLFNYVSTDGRGYEDYAWARLVNAGDNTTAAWLYTARSDNSARGSVVPGDVLKRQTDGKLQKDLDAQLNNGKSVGFDVSSTAWAPLGGWSGSCWTSANTCGPSGWIESEYDFARGGDFVLEMGVVNWGDELFDSALAFDFKGLRADDFSGLRVLDPSTDGGTVPTPATPALALAGLGLLAAQSRRRR